ncbi:universal stress protein [Gordonia sp. TBRC 11910]|uniref:Universal stress protein n=1 Tax=Gordonia asplenii TaxID=2725283 RepID=A0A848L4A0_9ACTN|nr:universal stress protein [Gordonia asplenii]NMO03875.1 universal stress protein [Gordonia asplenii]
MRSGPLTIAVGIDYSDESAAAARWAATMAEHHGWPMILVHGFAPPLFVGSLPGYRLDVAHDVARRRVESLADDLRLTFPDLHLSTLLSSDPAVPLLVKVSTEVDALILGHHRPGWAERLTSTSISCTLSGLSHCPVVTVPFGHVTPHGPIALAIDVDAPSQRAFEVAFDRAELTHRAVAVVCAIPDDLSLADVESTYARADALLTPWRRRYPDCPTTLQLIPGEPHRTLADAVPDASLQVVTRPRLRHSRTRWISSVARAMQRRANSPIAVVEYEQAP